MPKLFGLKFSVERGLTVVHKEKNFATDEARDKFIDQQVAKDNGFKIQAMSDPQEH